MASESMPPAAYGHQARANDAKYIGVCINCGKKITLCGKPFTAQIPCHKCLYINLFQESQQPVAGHW